jgi:RNA polymerase sigma-70 factor (ECF subfamily)
MSTEAANTRYIVMVPEIGSQDSCYKREGSHDTQYKDEPRMNAYAANFTVSCKVEDRREVVTLQREARLNRFFADVEKRALQIAEISIRDRDEALDLVQDAMIKLARNYAGRPDAEWTPLFYRILQNRIRDWQRRQAVKNKVMVFFGRGAEEEDYDPIAAAPDTAGRSPDQELQNEEAMEGLQGALAALSGRQREAFMLRMFEGLNVAGTAVAMGCSEGSVKTHYSRAVHSLRETLGEHWQ